MYVIMYEFGRVKSWKTKKFKVKFLKVKNLKVGLKIRLKCSPNHSRIDFGLNNEHASQIESFLSRFV